jgi:hypothetical protein
MVRSRAVTAVLFSIIASYSLAASADVTGTWSGGASLNAVCEYNDMQGHPIRVPFSGNVTVTLNLLQTGGSVSGTLEIDNFPDTNATCQVTGTLPPIIGPLTGTISGSNFSATATLPGDRGPNALPISATVNGSSMAFTVTESGAPIVNGTLTQTSTQPPASGLTGTYAGTYNAAIVPCGNPPAIPFSGVMTAGLIQAGTAITGSLTISVDKTDICPGSRTVVDIGPTTNLLTAQINGSSISGVVYGTKGEANPLTATVSGNTITGTAGQTPGPYITFTITRSSTGTPGPAILSFTVGPSTINGGDSSTLSWSVINANSVSIDNGIGTQNPSGSATVSPKQTTTYTLTATGPNGTAQGTTTITVLGAGARVVVGTLPSGILQAVGTSGATDSFTLSNVGTSAASVTLTQSGNSFSISPTSFTLEPGSSQVVTLTANNQQAGTYDGTITVSNGITVPVHLLVAAPPTAPVAPQATTPRSDFSLPAGQNPTGSISFKNNGTGTLQGIAVSDVPWITPQTGPITIAPGQTVQVSFSIDRSKRPDSAALVGGRAGKISLVYLTNASSKGVIALGGTPTGTVSVTIVDVVKPDVAAGSPPPLQSGEVAVFVAGLRTANRFNGDLLLSSRSNSASISDLRMFLTVGGNPTQVSALPSFASNVAVAFPAVIKNVFGITGLGGSLQMRSSETSNIAFSAVLSSNVANPAIASITALPILRSDRSIGPGERLVLAGAENSQSSTDAINTSVWVQEVSGNAGHVSFEYRDANGGIVGTDSGAVPAFTSVIGDAPAGARSVIVTNDSSSQARFAGYALVSADGSGDGWVLVDPAKQWGSASGALIMPMFAAGSQADLYVTNGSTAPVSVTIDVSSANRHHAVRSAGGGAQPAPQASTIAPMTTSRMTFTPANGFVRINTASGSVSATGRLTTSINGTSIGSSLPAVPTSAALGNGQGKRFTGIDDSSAKTIAAATPATYRTTLMLIETAGQSATVRVTLRYTFIAGETVSSQGVSSREFAVSPNQVLMIPDLARAIIGSQRDSFGDLRNIQVDVDVIDGSGKVLGFLEAIDNASGDIAVRAE